MLYLKLNIMHRKIILKIGITQNTFKKNIWKGQIYNGIVSYNKLSRKKIRSFRNFMKIRINQNRLSA